MDAVIDAVRVAGTPQGPAPLVLLAVDGEDEVLPIFIGFDEARSIAQGVDAIDIGRPLTHDLLLDTVEELGGRIAGVEIHTVDDGTFIADLLVATPRGDTVRIDARPSDCLALASRTNAAIDVADTVFDQGAEPREGYDDLDDIREVLG